MKQPAQVPHDCLHVALIWYDWLACTLQHFVCCCVIAFVTDAGIIREHAPCRCSSAACRLASLGCWPAMQAAAAWLQPAGGHDRGVCDSR